MYLRSYQALEKFVWLVRCWWVVVLKVTLVLALVQNQGLGFGFGLGPS